MSIKVKNKRGQASLKPNQWGQNPFITRCFSLQFTKRIICQIGADFTQRRAFKLAVIRGASEINCSTRSVDECIPKRSLGTVRLQRHFINTVKVRVGVSHKLRS